MENVFKPSILLILKSTENKIKTKIKSILHYNKTKPKPNETENGKN
jgi:hypothetical protein